MAKELLTDSGSIFVQISDENFHRVRCLLDEVFGAENFVSQITIKKTTGSTADFIPGSCDYVLWYGRDKEVTRFRPIFDEKKPGDEGATGYSRVELPTGERRMLRETEASSPDSLPKHSIIFTGDNITSQSLGREKGEGAASWFKVTVDGHEFTPGPKARWKTNEEGMKRLLLAERLIGGDRTTLSYKRTLSDFPVTPLGNVWSDTVGQNQLGGEKIYIVQTALKIVERCLLMTTDPGDLVLDPTCGSGTTAYVAEQWGRRWITCDSSRVALVLAKHRLMTAKFDYQQLRPLSAEDLLRNPNGTWLTDPTGKVPDRVTFHCKTVPHVTLKSIARNSSLDPIFAKHQPILVEKLAAVNREAAKVGAALKEKLVEKLICKHRQEGANAVSDADTRRWLLPDTLSVLIRSFPTKKPLKGVTPKQAEAYRTAIPKGGWKEWEMPFDTDPDWPKPLQDALTAYRAEWRVKMNEVNACISANAEIEELVDMPDSEKGVVRVTGPFTMEGVIAVEEGPDTPIGGPPEELEAFDGNAAVVNAEAHLDKLLRLLKASGVDFPGNKNMKFAWLDPLTGASLIHAEGEWTNGDKTVRRVAVSVGPEVGNVSAMQVEDVIRVGNRKGYDELVFAGFGFDAAAQEAIESASHPRLRLHMALIRPDVAMGDLLKAQPGSQLFTVFSAPRVKGPTQQDDGDYTVEVEGMDVYDPVSNTLFPTDKQRIAAWFLDTDYDGRTFCICQAFFPDKSKWSKLAKALGDADVIEEDAFESLSGLTSLPFPRPARLGHGETWRVAVKVIDPRGNEGLRVLTLN
jgi:adenine-specific DNA-methyltransferase